MHGCRLIVIRQSMEAQQTPGQCALDVTLQFEASVWLSWRTIGELLAADDY